MKNYNGFTLVEVMVSVAIAGVTTLAVLNASQSITAATKGQSTIGNAATFTSLVAQTLRFQSTCQAAVRNGANLIAYDQAQAEAYDGIGGNSDGIPLAITIDGLRAGPNANVNQVTGSMNAVAFGNVPAYPGATSDLGTYGLKLRRIAFRQLAASGNLRYGVVFMDLEKNGDDGRLNLGGNALPRKFLGGVVLALSGGNIVDCYGNSPAADLATVCTNMGCTYSGTTCTCPKGEFTCPPGAFLTAITGGVPRCTYLGAGQCPSGQYLKGIGLNRIACSAVPDRYVAAAPAPPGPTCKANGELAGALYGTCVGSPSNLAEIKASCCAGDTYSVCDASSDKLYYCGAAPGPNCTGGATTTLSAVPAAPAGCYCAAGQTWDGTNCTSGPVQCYGYTTTLYNEANGQTTVTGQHVSPSQALCEAHRTTADSAGGCSSPLSCGTCAVTSCEPPANPGPTTCPVGQCCPGRPLIIAQDPGFGSTLQCHEYSSPPGEFVSPNSPKAIQEAMNAGDTRYVPSNGCSGADVVGNTQCNGNMIIRCEANGTITRIDAVCSPGIED